MPRTYGTTTQRGYDGQHQKLRAQLIRELNRLGSMPCPRCRLPIYAWMQVDLGHTEDRTGYTGLEHVSCNRKAGAIRGNKLRGLRRRIVRAATQSREW